MGQILNTNAFTMMHFKQWNAKWFQDHFYCYLLHEDIQTQTYMNQCFQSFGYIPGKLLLKRTEKKIYIYLNIYQNPFYSKKTITNIQKDQILIKNIQQIHKVFTEIFQQQSIFFIRTTNKLDSKVICSLLAIFLKKGKSLRFSFSRILQLLKKDERILGIRVECSGRPKKMEMAQTEWIKNGPTPLHSYCNKIDYANSTVLLKYGICGIKTWLYFQ